MSCLSDLLGSGGLDPGHLGFFEPWRPVEPMWRVYSQSFGAAAFNGTSKGFSRFSPLERPDGNVVPTLYAGTTLDVALMEIVLRDVPTPSVGFQLMLPAPNAELRRVTELVVATPLRMIDFGTIGLRRFGLDRRDVIDCDSENYPDTQALGAWAHAHTQTTDPGETVRGIVWTWRQDDAGQAVVFFGDRVEPGTIAARNPGQSFHAGNVEVALMGLARRLGVSVISS